ncbi:VOC family protein [Nocardia amikacinitolerans]|uniref:VOC family protein n=1 Tax=Nocardia amikacinitolerans TaxID=756689 RepID=UPI0020A33F2D|nr:VOC family protein [Nocardia amikacinitolerans]MCP2288716.1 Glyoxalase/Bleomycin resistance protein/Dioxygenase superfamily protein [Nocardia amikacinitolerans]
MSYADGPITQIAWVTDDIEKAERFFVTHFGVRKWTRIPDVEFGPRTCTYRGRPADFTAHIALSYLDDIQLELIQPLRGESIYAEFLARRGPGLHHVCFEPDDFDGAVAAAERDGLTVVQRGDMAADMRFAYVDGASEGVPFIELAEIGPAMRAFFDQVRGSAT